jgi:F420-non-reducing hydrogenase small subunit
MIEKPKISIYWASSCGGCEIAFANLHEKILDVIEHFDLVFCPCLIDAKRKDIEAMPDGAIALTLFNGAIRTDENYEMALLLRKKSRLLVAYGACAYGGGLPALSNFSEKTDLFQTIYRKNPTIDNPEGILPQQSIAVPEGELRLPEFHDTVKTLAQVTDVDYMIPGCPPESHQLWNVLELLIQKKELPEKGSVIGAGESSVCNECRRKRTEKKITRLHRIWEIIPDRENCLLEQGILCMGIVTRDGCGGLCPEVNMPCIGCYGPPADVYDQGAKMASVLGSILNIDPHKGKDIEEIQKNVTETLDIIPDFAGVCYKFHLAGSLLRKKASVRTSDHE